MYMTQQASFNCSRYLSTIDISTEDTFLLLDGIEKDAEQLRTQKSLICLEIG